MWVIALGLSAGYLINKNMVIAKQLDDSVAEFNSAAKPATGLGAFFLARCPNKCSNSFKNEFFRILVSQNKMRGLPWPRSHHLVVAVRAVPSCPSAESCWPQPAREFTRAAHQARRSC